jgi:hypothetical protein
VDGVRKERQKGIKRGPYKRKNKATNSDTATSPAPNANFESASWLINNALRLLIRTINRFSLPPN